MSEAVRRKGKRMSGFQHPGEDLLLRYIDGEIAGWKRRQIRRHLEACWQCRGAVEELQQTVADCVRYRKEIPAYLPAPPRAWSDLAGEFARVDAAMAGEPFWKRFVFPVLKPALAGMAVLALLAVVIYQFEKAPAVKAAVLLQRAVVAESARAAAPHAIRIRTRNASFTRATASHDPIPAEAERLFAEAHYNGEDPLSARSYMDWHNSLESQDDPVETVPDPVVPSESCYRIHTVPASGEVSGATLLLSTADYHAVDGMLEFRDRNFVEFTELMGSPAGGGNAAARVESPVRPSVPSRSDAVVPGASASISDQLAVYSALHQIGADLGGSIEVSLASGKVMVGGVGVASEVQQRVHHELDSLPNVSIQFSEPRAIPAAALDNAETARAASAAPQTRLEDRLGRVEFQRFRDAVLKSDETVMDRAYALRTLARTFPVEVESGLSSSDRRMLRDMLRDHLSHLSKQVSEVQSLLQPSLSAIGATVQARGVAEGTVWQSSVEDVIRASQLVEVRLSVLLGVTPAQNSTSTQLPSDVLTALDDLRLQTDHCTSLISQ